MGRGNLKYLFLKQKFYFDTGLGVSGYFKYVIIGFGISFKDPMLTAFIALLSLIGCYVIGFLWVKYDMTLISNDIANQYNPFVKATLKGLKERKLKPLSNA